MDAATTMIPVAVDAGTLVAGTLDVPVERPTTSDRGRAEGPRVRQVSRPLTALAGRTLLGLTSRCSLRGVHALARRVGDLGYALPLRESRATRVNVSLCFPELTGADRRRFERQSLEEAACMVGELGHLWLRPIDEILDRVVEVRGEEHLREAIARGRGVVVAGPHLGAWELLGLWMAVRYSITSLYRKQRVRQLDGLFWTSRSRSGARLLPADASGIRASCQALRRGEVVGILPDQDPGAGWGEFAPFFGVPANTSTLVPRLASRFGSAVLLAFAERLPNGAGYRIHIRPGSGEIACGNFLTGARALNRDVESLVRIAPLQYLWSYKRFRTRPPGSPSFYCGPAGPDRD
jgi:Kdo2-lipid IVA lauroyltransferase/acyltransferase